MKEKKQKVRHSVNENKDSGDSLFDTVETILTLASKRGDLERAKNILNDGADIEMYNKNGFTPLIVAIKNGRLEMIKLLISKGANIKKRDNGNHTPLMYAVRTGNFNIVKFLLDNGGDLNESFPLLMIAVCIGMTEDTTDVIELLLEKGANIEQKYDGLTSLIVASLRGTPNIVKSLLQHGASIEATDSKDRQPLEIALVNNKYNIINHLFQFSNGSLSYFLIFLLKYENYNIINYNILKKKMLCNLTKLIPFQNIDDELKLIKKQATEIVKRIKDLKGLQLFHSSIDNTITESVRVSLKRPRNNTIKQLYFNLVLNNQIILSVIAATPFTEEIANIILQYI